MKLLVDIGNTRLKCALWNGSRIEPLASATHALSADNVDLDTLWKDTGEVTAIHVASVAGTALEQRLVRSLGRQYPLVPRFATSVASACGVSNAYAQPERLGVDRFLGLVALHAERAGPCVLAGCGTALTLDALGADGRHHGGLISASPALMIDALTGGTARLAKPQSARVVELADNTGDAIESGTWLAAAALVERFVARAAVHLGAMPALVLSGGGAARLGEVVALPHRIDGELVLRGLGLYADSVT